MTEHWLECFDGWADEPGPPPSLPRELVHKHRAENVLVSRIQRVDTHRFATQLVFDPAHAFFFEHPVDHVPGLALIEAGRQVGLAVSHLFYRVPENQVFFIRDLSVSFQSFAHLDAPVFGLGVVSDVRSRKDRLHRMTFTGHFLQEGRAIGSTTGSWSVVDQAVLERARTREAAAK